MKTVLKVGILLALMLFSSCEEKEYTTKSTVYGVVMDARDNTPLEGVIVVNETTGKNCITGTNGYYEFQNLRFNKVYRIRAKKEGYESFPVSIKPTEVRDRIELNILLKVLPQN